MRKLVVASAMRPCRQFCHRRRSVRFPLIFSPKKLHELTTVHGNKKRTKHLFWLLLEKCTGNGCFASLRNSTWKFNLNCLLTTQKLQNFSDLTIFNEIFDQQKMTIPRLLNIKAPYHWFVDSTRLHAVPRWIAFYACLSRLLTRNRTNSQINSVSCVCTTSSIWLNDNVDTIYRLKLLETSVTIAVTYPCHYPNIDADIVTTTLDAIEALQRKFSKTT